MIARTVIIAVATILLCASLIHAAALPYKVVVEKEGPDEEAFAKITAALTEAKVNAALIDGAFKSFDRYIDRRVDKERKSVTLYPQTIFEITKNAAAQSWQASEIGDLLIYAQKEIDEENSSGTRLKRIAVAEIAKGKKLHDVIDALEKSEGADDDDKH